MPGCRLSVVLAIDAAYAEFVNRNDYEAGVRLVDRVRHVVMLRTFSKIYALGRLAARLGLLPAGNCGCAEPGARAVQCYRRRRSPPVWRRLRMSRPAAGDAARSSTHWLPWFSERLRSSGLSH